VHVNVEGDIGYRFLNQLESEPHDAFYVIVLVQFEVQKYDFQDLDCVDSVQLDIRNNVDKCIHKLPFVVGLQNQEFQHI